MRTQDAIKGKEWAVLAHYGHQRTNNRHKDCPVCGKKKSFRLNEYQGRPAWICTCGSGDLISLLMQTTGMSFKFLANEIDKVIGNTQDRQAAPLRRDYEGELLALWKTLKPIKGTSVQRYLQGRGIYSIPPRAIKIKGNDQDSQMFAVATNDAGVPRITHTTYLQGDKKADIDVPKRWLTVDRDKKTDADEVKESVAIRMFEVQSCLGISEGIESALSAHALYQVACWSVLSTSVMKNFRAPTGVSHLIIFADSDNNGAGLAAAFACGHSNILAKNDVEKVTIRYPQSGDFNDCLLCAQNINDHVLTK